MRRLVPSTARPARRRDAATASADYGAGATPDWRTVDWPAHVRDAELPDGPVHYADLGGGDPGRDASPPVVLAHGLGGSWQNWLETMPALAQRGRVVALDLPGFGRSPLAGREVSITGFAGVVEALCEHLGLGAVAVIGNSMGGFIAADLAIGHPDRVERLVLIDAAGISTAELHRRPVRTLTRVLAGASPPPGQSPGLRRPALLQATLAAVFRHPTRLARDLLAEQAAGGWGSPGFVQAMDALLDYDVRERLPEIACPTLVVHGTEDMLVPVADAHAYARLIPDARTLILEDTGHVPMLERPTVLNPRLLEFLDEPPRGAPRGDVAREPAVGDR